LTNEHTTPRVRINAARTLAGEEQTDAFARELARELAPGDTVWLIGELGAGKTRLARGIVAALGHPPNAVSSPTFAIANHYRTPGATSVLHIDAYRLDHTEDADELLADLGAECAHEHNDRSPADPTDRTRTARKPAPVILVEWPERLPPGSLPPTLTVRLHHAGPDARLAIVEPHTPDAAQPATSSDSLKL
jgi:tRNA threonylcarbamoyl adenosine modification protein YjeE